MSLRNDPACLARASPGSCMHAGLGAPTSPCQLPHPIPFPKGTLVPGSAPLPTPCITGIDGARSIPPAGD